MMAMLEGEKNVSSGCLQSAAGAAGIGIPGWFCSCNGSSATGRRLWSRRKSEIDAPEQKRVVGDGVASGLRGIAYQRDIRDPKGQADHGITVAPDETQNAVGQNNLGFAAWSLAHRDSDDPTPVPCEVEWIGALHFDNLQRL